MDDQNPACKGDLRSGTTVSGKLGSEIITLQNDNDMVLIYLDGGRYNLFLSALPCLRDSGNRMQRFDQLQAAASNDQVVVDNGVLHA